MVTLLFSLIQFNCGRLSHGRSTPFSSYYRLPRDSFSKIPGIKSPTSWDFDSTSWQTSAKDLEGQRTVEALLRLQKQWTGMWASDDTLGFTHSSQVFSYESPASVMATNEICSSSFSAILALPNVLNSSFALSNFLNGSFPSLSSPVLPTGL